MHDCGEMCVCRRQFSTREAVKSGVVATCCGFAGGGGASVVVVVSSWVRRLSRCGMFSGTSFVSEY